MLSSESEHHPFSSSERSYPEHWEALRTRLHLLMFRLIFMVSTPWVPDVDTLQNSHAPHKTSGSQSAG